MSNTKFKWDEALVTEFVKSLYPLSDFTPMERRISQFKESKQPKPEWEILTLRNGQYEYQKVGDVWTFGLHSVTLSWALDNGYKIHSVKRLSDGVVFTINDKFTATAGCPLTIKAFDIDDYLMRVHTVEYGYWFLGNIKKAKEVLFKTEDGVDLYKDSIDQISIVYPDFSINHGWSVKDYIISGYKGAKLFSSEEKANEYVLMNKPLFSINEIIDKVNEASQSNVGNKLYQEPFIEKAKEKLNKTL